MTKLYSLYSSLENYNAKGRKGGLSTQTHLPFFAVKFAKERSCQPSGRLRRQSHLLGGKIIIGEKSMQRALILSCTVVMFASGCTTANRIYEKDGKEALLIECGASVSFSVCHGRARKECPNGYNTLSEDAGLNRKEIRVRCN